MNDLDERLKSICEKVARRFYCQNDSSEDLEDVVQDAIVVALQKKIEPPTNESERRLAYSKIRLGLIDKLRARTCGRTFKKKGVPLPVFLNSGGVIESEDFGGDFIEAAVAQKTLREYETRRREESRDSFSYAVRQKNGTYVRKTVSERTLEIVLRRTLGLFTKRQRTAINSRLDGDSIAQTAEKTNYSESSVWVFLSKFRKRFREEMKKVEQ